VANRVAGTPTRRVLGRDDDGRPTTADKFAEAGFLEPWRTERVDGRLRVLPSSRPGLEIPLAEVLGR